MSDTALAKRLWGAAYDATPKRVFAVVLYYLLLWQFRFSKTMPSTVWDPDHAMRDVLTKIASAGMFGPQDMLHIQRFLDGRSRDD